jgi:hypothetical protein
MVTTAQVILHFVGLATFLPPVPNDPILNVILPRVVYTDTRTPIAMAKSGRALSTVTPSKSRTTASFSSARRVEDHMAILVYRANSYVSSTNWSRFQLPGTPPPNFSLKTSNPPVAYEYVQLERDQVQFTSGISDQPLDLSAMTLPPLESLCPSMTSLNADFRPPYAGAAGVVEIPHGVVKACYAGMRIDTEIKLDSTGDLVVSANNPRAHKELRLKPVGGRVELIVANIPLSCLNAAGCMQPALGSVNSLAHTHVYYEMVDKSTQCNGTIQTWNLQADAARKPGGTCTIGVPKAAGGLGMHEQPDGGPLHHDNITDFECSNSRFP